jgi:hypothetical protein
VTEVLVVRAPDGGTERPAAGWRARLLAVVLALGAALLLALAGFRAAESSLQLDPVTPAFSGSAPAVTLPTYGAQGMHVVGYEHGATARISLPIRNPGLLPLTITSIDLRGGVAPLLVVQEVAGLPLPLRPGQTGTIEVTAELANCRFFHEREIQNYAGFDLGVSLLGQSRTRYVEYDRPVMVHSPMIVGCPERQLNRQADNRSDLTGAA